MQIRISKIICFKCKFNYNSYIVHANDIKAVFDICKKQVLFFEAMKQLRRQSPLRTFSLDLLKRRRFTRPFTVITFL